MATPTTTFLASQDRQPEDDRARDVEWLKRTLVGLLENAAGADVPEHAACAKYAELLFKMLPKGKEEKPSESAIELVRKTILGQGSAS